MNTATVNEMTAAHARSDMRRFRIARSSAYLFYLLLAVVGMTLTAANCRIVPVIVIHAISERPLGFQLASPVSSVWAIWAAVSYVVPLSGQAASRRAIPWYFRSGGEETRLHVTRPKVTSNMRLAR